MYFHRMPTPPSGYQTGSSSRRQERQRKKRKLQRQTRYLTCQMRKMRATASQAPEITWTKIKRLVKEAKSLLIQQGKSLKPSLYFLAFLALMSAFPTVQGMAYWVYVPNPLILQPVGWLDQEPIRILTNDTGRLGGAQDSDARISSSSLITFEGCSDSLPICIVFSGKVPKFCLSSGYRTFLMDSPDKENVGKRWIWEIQMQTIGE